MKTQPLYIILLAFVLVAGCASKPDPVDPAVEQTRAKLQALASSDLRPAASRARNDARHPVETLMFFGIRDDMTVVEISPGTGAWYTEILAPFLRENGKFYAAAYNVESDNEYQQKGAIKLNEKLISKPELFEGVELTVFDVPTRMEPAPDGSADMVLTFRSYHGWSRGGNELDAMRAMYRALKPGGILGFVQHRLPEDAPDPEKMGEKGYVKTSHVLAAAKLAGFELVARSEINANPLDTADYEKGVWSLPPALGAGDEERYRAIGESDRMTLKFRKPE